MKIKKNQGGKYSMRCSMLVSSLRKIWLRGTIDIWIRFCKSIGTLIFHRLINDIWRPRRNRMGAWISLRGWKLMRLLEIRSRLRRSLGKRGGRSRSRLKRWLSSWGLVMIKLKLFSKWLRIKGSWIHRRLMNLRTKSYNSILR